MTSLPTDVAACRDSHRCKDRAQCLRHKPEPADRRVWADLYKAWAFSVEHGARPCPYFLERAK